MFAAIVRVIPVIAAAIAAVEKLVTEKGKAKQDAAADMIAMFAPLTGVITDAEMRDPRVQSALRASIDANVALVNALTAVRNKTLAG